MSLWDTLKEKVRSYATASDDENKQESSEPWVQIIGADANSDEGIKIELDWNQAFVDYLRDNGIKGTDDEQVVQRWLTILLQELTQDDGEVKTSDGSEFE